MSQLIGKLLCTIGRHSWPRQALGSGMVHVRPCQRPGCSEVKRTWWPGTDLDYYRTKSL